MPRARVFLSPWIMVSLSVFLDMVAVGLGIAQQPAEDGKYPKEVFFDFRGKPLPPELTVSPKGVDRFIQSEPEGLRVTLPKDRKDLAPFELSTRTGIQGDFEITATFEILHAERPQGFGVGTAVFINKVNPRTEGATLGRLLRANGEEELFWDRGFARPGDQMEYDIDWQPCAEKRFRLRLKRTGSQLAYFLGPGLSGENFQELPPKDFGGNDIEKVKLRVTSGREPCSVDARLVDLRIRSGRVPDAIPMPVVGAAAVFTPASGSRAWLVVALLIALSISLAFNVVFAVWVYVRRSNSAPI